MTKIIVGQLQFILLMLCGGMGIMACYDGMRLFRWLIPHGKAAKVLEDLLYWCVASVPAFYMFYRLADGEIRWYGMTTLLGGIALYEFGISVPVRKCLDRIVTPWKYKIFRFFRKCFRKLKKKCQTHRNRKKKRE